MAESYPIAAIVRAGGSLQLFKNLLIASDLNYTEKQLYLHGGAEYSRPFGPVTLALRAGYKNDTVKELGALSGLTAGLGVGDPGVDRRDSGGGAVAAVHV